MQLRRSLSWVGVTLVLIGLLGSVHPAAAATGSQASKLHPVLGTLMARTPGQQVDVLVQVERGASGKDLARKAGATFKQQWSVAPAVLLSLPAARANTLAADPRVRWVTPDATIKPTSAGLSNPPRFPEQVQATGVWSAGYTGAGVGVAFLDSGIAAHPALPEVVAVHAGSLSDGIDRTGHGTHVAGIIGARSERTGFSGVAPGSRLISVKVLDDVGTGRLSNLLSGLQWVQENRERFNIRVVNLSLQSTVADSYQRNPINEAVQALWHSGIVVVAAAGNSGLSSLAVSRPPANDPYAITVGALDDGGTLDPGDDSLAYFSSRGITMDGLAKPEVVAPGRQVLSTLAADSLAANRYPERVVGGEYLPLSGTSMAAPMVSGVAALLLEAYPHLTPAEVKWLLINTARPYRNQPDAAGLVNAEASLAAVPAMGTTPMTTMTVAPVTLSQDAFMMMSVPAEEPELLGEVSRWSDDPW